LRRKGSRHGPAARTKGGVMIPSTPIGLLMAATREATTIEQQAAMPAKKALSVADADGRAPLALAAQCDQPELVLVLLKLKAPVDAVDVRGNTALMLAAARGNRLAVEYLLEACARVDACNAAGQRAVDLTAGAEIRRMLQLQADRDLIECKLKMSKSCSLPSLVKTSSQSPKRKSSKDATYRVRLDGLSKRHPAARLEELICEMLEASGATRPSHVDVAVDPISMKPRGYAYVDYPTSRHAEVAHTSLRAESTLRVSLAAS